MNNASALSRIEALAYVFGNADSQAMHDAAQNAANNAPAFWHRAGAGNAVVGGFMFYLNHTQDVIRAWEAYETAFGARCRMREPRFLDQLLPLNRAAAVSLGKAYEEISTFRTDSELLGRTLAAEDRALEALGSLRTGGSVFGEVDARQIEASVEAIADHRAQQHVEAHETLKQQLVDSLAEAV